MEYQSPAQAAADLGAPLGIAICLSHFHPIVGGAERQMLALARRWAASDHRPIVFTRPIRGLAKHDMIDGVEVRRTIATIDRGPMFGATFLASLLRELATERRRYDVILAAQSKWEAVATGAAARRLGKPSVARVASVGPVGDVAEIAGARGTWLWRRWFRANDAFLAPSELARQELLSIGCDAARIRASTNGVDTLALKSPAVDDAERQRTALFVGRLTTVKDPLAALAAWKLVNADGRYRLLIAGDGPLADSMRRYVAEHALAGVEFLGHCQRMEEVYPRAGVLIQSSPHEGCSNAVLEAMACGLCAVVTSVPSDAQLVRHEVTGLTARAGDAEALADELRRALSDDALRARLSAAARQHVEQHHALDLIAGTHIELFRELLAVRGATGAAAARQ